MYHCVIFGGMVSSAATEKLARLDSKIEQETEGSLRKVRSSSKPNELGIFYQDERENKIPDLLKIMYNFELVFGLNLNKAHRYLYYLYAKMWKSSRGVNTSARLCLFNLFTGQILANDYRQRSVEQKYISTSTKFLNVFSVITNILRFLLVCIHLKR